LAYKFALHAVAKTPLITFVVFWVYEVEVRVYSRRTVISIDAGVIEMTLLIVGGGGFSLTIFTWTCSLAFRTNVFRATF
jgi:hypothetical protein